MRPLYLHAPITTPKQVERILKLKKTEDVHHDWKADWWDDKDEADPAEEAAKDVTAMLNAEGGTILVGIDEGKNSEAGQLFFRAGKDGEPDRVFKPGKRRLPKQLEDWLQQRLEPSEARTYVSTKQLKVKDGKGIERDVLAINVAPWPHGPVGVKCDASRDLYRFVVREGEHARPMAWEEVVRRTDAGNRAMYLRLKGYLGDGKKKIAIRSAFQVRVKGQVVEFSIDVSYHAFVVPRSLQEDHLVLHLICQEPAANTLQLQLVQRRDLSSRSHRAVDRIFGRKATSSSSWEPQSLTVPLGYVEGVWEERQVINLALSTTIRWAEFPQRWVLAPNHGS